MMDINSSGRHGLATLLSVIVLTFISACAQVPLQQQESTSEPPTLPSGSGKAARPPAAMGPVTLRPDHPQTYVIAPGDTLVGIAERFLEAPWRWPEVWRSAPGAGDPKQLYPGDIIELYYENGQPRLRLASGQSTVRLSPQVRATDLSQPIPTVPRRSIEAFIKRSLVLSSRADWERAPSIIGNADDRVALGTGERIYVSGLEDSDQRQYRVFRPGQEYRDPNTDQSLGIAGLFVSDAVLQQEGDPATLMLTATRYEARKSDRLFPVEDEVEVYSFLPHPPPPDTEGLIIAPVLDNVILISQYQSAVINLGEEDGMAPGHMLAIYSAGRDVSGPGFGSTVQLPDEKVGLLMVYKVYDQVSYGLVLHAERSIRVLDRVTNP